MFYLRQIVVELMPRRPQESFEHTGDSRENEPILILQRGRQVSDGYI